MIFNLVCVWEEYIREHSDSDAFDDTEKSRTKTMGLAVFFV